MRFNRHIHVKKWSDLYDNASRPGNHCSRISTTVRALRLTFLGWESRGWNLRIVSFSYVRRVWLESCRWPGFQDNAALGSDWYRRAKHSRRYTCTALLSQPRDSQTWTGLELHWSSCNQWPGCCLPSCRSCRLVQDRRGSNCGKATRLSLQLYQ